MFVQKFQGFFQFNLGALLREMVDKNLELGFSHIFAIKSGVGQGDPSFQGNQRGIFLLQGKVIRGANTTYLVNPDHGILHLNGAGNGPDPNSRYR